MELGRDKAKATLHDRGPVLVEHQVHEQGEVGELILARQEALALQLAEEARQIPAVVAGLRVEGSQLVQDVWCGGMEAREPDEYEFGVGLQPLFVLYGCPPGVANGEQSQLQAAQQAAVLLAVERLRSGVLGVDRVGEGQLTHLAGDDGRLP